MLARRPSPIPLESPPPRPSPRCAAHDSTLTIPIGTTGSLITSRGDEEIRMPLTRRHGRCGPQPCAAEDPARRGAFSSCEGILGGPVR